MPDHDEFQSFPDLGSLDDRELKELIDELESKEHGISYRRRVLHGHIDILRAELVSRLRRRHLAEPGGLDL